LTTRDAFRLLLTDPGDGPLIRVYSRPLAVSQAFDWSAYKSPNKAVEENGGPALSFDWHYEIPSVIFDIEDGTRPPSLTFGVGDGRQ